MGRTGQPGCRLVILRQEADFQLNPFLLFWLPGWFGLKSRRLNYRNHWHLHLRLFGAGRGERPRPCYGLNGCRAAR